MDSFDKLSPADKCLAVDLLYQNKEFLKQKQEREQEELLKLSNLLSSQYKLDSDAHKTWTETNKDTAEILNLLKQHGSQAQNELDRIDNIFEYPDLLQKYASQFMPLDISQFITLDAEKRITQSELANLNENIREQSRRLDELRLQHGHQSYKYSTITTQLNTMMGDKNDQLQLKNNCRKEISKRAIANVPYVPPPVYWFETTKICEYKVVQVIAKSPCGCLCHFLDAHQETHISQWVEKTVCIGAICYASLCPYHIVDIENCQPFIKKLHTIQGFNVPANIQIVMGVKGL